ncbi:SSA2 [Mytilus edulis]|uniref:TROVE2 n=1 Tax=Mytilus edulis TaxID=6550 RepID=A0A8S3SJ96_MYTED|nr:SSA2 [Mytilus edulis]
MGISNWYNSFQSKDPQDHKSAKKLAYLVTKYKRRHGWTHRDAVRLAHVHPRTTDIRLIIEYIFGENITVNITPNQASIGEFLDAARKAKQCNDVEEIRSLIANYHLSREHIPTRFLNNIAVWEIKRVKEQCQQSPGRVSEDLAVPFKWAASRQKRFDVIVVLTDSLTSCGYMHPAEMLKQYMRYVAIDKYHLIVVGMTDNDYTIASPIDMNALDVVGFDLHTPSVIRNFVNDFQSDPSMQTDNPYADLEEMENVTLY